MNQYAEPIRLLDAPPIEGLDGLAGLRSDLAAAAANPPVRYSVEVGLLRLRSTLSGPGAGSPPPAAAGDLTKLALAGAVALVLAGGLALALARGAGGDPEAELEATRGAGVATDEPRPEPTPPAPASAAASASPELGPPAAPAIEPYVVEPAPSGRTAVAPRRRPAAPEPAAAASDFAREARRVREAEAALDREPARALALLEAIDREFPRGQLLEEREGLRVLALLRSGAVDDGRRRGDAYLARHPRGTLAARVRRALAELP